MDKHKKGSNNMNLPHYFKEGNFEVTPNNQVVFKWFDYELGYSVFQYIHPKLTDLEYDWYKNKYLKGDW